MRILTVRQPWAWAIIHGGKDVENRVRNLAGRYRGPVAIHAGVAYDHEAALWMPGSRCPDRDSVSLVYGAIIGVVDLVDVHHSGASDFGGEGTRFAAFCSPWSQQDAWHLELANPRPLVEPIPYTGALGLRDLAVRDPQTVLAIARQIGRVS